MKFPFLLSLLFLGLGLPAHSQSPYAVKFVKQKAYPLTDIEISYGTTKWSTVDLDFGYKAVSFMASAYNPGPADLQNCYMIVELVSVPGGQLVRTYTSPIVAQWDAGDTLGYAVLKSTQSWTQIQGDYEARYSIYCDSIPAFSPRSDADTMSFQILSWTLPKYHIQSTEFSGASDGVGWSQDYLAVAQALHFPDPPGYRVNLLVRSLDFSLWPGFDTTGMIALEIYDTTGFTYGKNGGFVGSPILVRTINLDKVDRTTNRVRVDLTGLNGGPLLIPGGTAYFFNFNLVPNQTNGQINLANDRSVRQDSNSLAALTVSGEWVQPPAEHMTNLPLSLEYDVLILGQEEQGANYQMALYPNPVSNEFFLQMDRPGRYILEIMDLQGRVLHREEVQLNGVEKLLQPVENLPAGSYLVRLSEGQYNAQARLVLTR